MKTENKANNSFAFDLNALFEENSREWWIALQSYESDRTVAIIAMCVLDDLLKKLLKSALINHRKSEGIFKDEHIMQTTSAKIQMAFFLGLIPEKCYEDLIKMNRIRNIFAHSMAAKMTFENERIYNLLIKFNHGPRNIGDEKMPGTRFLIATQLLIDSLLTLLILSETAKLPKMIEYYHLEKLHFSGLSKEQIQKIVKRSTKLWYEITQTSNKDWNKGDIIHVDPNAKLKNSDIVACIYEVDPIVRTG